VEVGDGIGGRAEEGGGAERELLGGDSRWVGGKKSEGADGVESVEREEGRFEQSWC